MTAPVATVPTVPTVLGSVNVDLVSRVERFPRPGETLLGSGLSREPGGKGANQAVAAARLAGAARLVGAVGRDPDGDLALDALRSAGVDTSGVARVGSPTGTAVITVDAAGENQIVVHAGANEHVAVPDGVEDLPLLLCQLEVPLDVVTEAARRCRGYVVLNAAPARSLPEDLVRACDLVVVNEEEHAAMPEVGAAALVAVTYGARGAMLLRGGEEAARAPGEPAEVVSSVGAGDAFTAALALGLAAGDDPESALAVACAVGADAVRDARAQPPLARLRAYRSRLEASLDGPTHG